MTNHECVNATGCTNRQEPGCGLGGCKDRKPDANKQQPLEFAVVPPSTLEDKLLELHILFLKHFKKLSARERKAFGEYLSSLANPLIISNSKSKV